MQGFLTQSRLSYVALFYWLHLWGYVSNVVLGPLLELFTFALVATFATGAESAQRFMVGMIAIAIAVIVQSGILQSFAYDRDLGTLSFLFSTPASRLAVFASRGAWHLPNGILAGLSTLVLAALLFGLDTSGLAWPTALAGIALMAASSTTFGLLMGNWAAATRGWFIPTATSRAVLIGFTGVIVPTEELPGVASRIGTLLPLTHGLAAVRAAFSGAPIADAGGMLACEGLIAIGYALAAYALFRWLERRARLTGSFELGT